MGLFEEAAAVEAAEGQRAPPPETAEASPTPVAFSLFGQDLFGEAAKPTVDGVLRQKFIFPPFTVLDARSGDWQERKRAWLSLGIKSEVGRGENLLKFSDTVLEPDPEKRAKGRHGSTPSDPTILAYLKTGNGRPPEVFEAEKKGETNKVQELLAQGGRAALVAALESGALTWEQAAPQFGGVPDNKEAAIAGWYKKRSDGMSEAEIIADALIAAEDGRGTALNGTSVFDPVLCELAYSWFCPRGGLVLDPFAGGSVRGLLAAALGRRYWGSELREEQVAANREQAVAFAMEPRPEWVCGDSAVTLASAPEADFVFSCPPYGSLERYSDDPLDLSTMSWDGFVEAYYQIILGAVARLKRDRFACFVVGDFRNGEGWYCPLVTETIAAFESCGARLYNHAILVNSVGSAAIRATRVFGSGRKLVKLHQNFLVFAKGDPVKAATACKVGETQ